METSNTATTDKAKATPTEGSLAQAAPSSLAAAPAPKRGLERPIDAEDVILPRVRLLQPTTPEVIQQSVPGAKMGALMNSLTKEILQGEFIPIVFFKNWARFNPRKKEEAGYDPNVEPGKMMWMTYDKNDPRVEKEAAWGPNGEKPIATAFLNFLAYFPGQKMPAILSFSKTSYKAGKQFRSLVDLMEGDLFSNKYKLNIESKSNDQGTFAIVKSVDPSGKADPGDFAKCEAWWEQFAPTITRVRMDDLAEEDVPAGSAAGGKEEDIPF